MSENLKTVESPEKEKEKEKMHSEKTVSILKLPERGIINESAAGEDGAADIMAGPRNAGLMNAIISGSKLTGNMVITRDLEITGDYEGDITSEENSNIFIKGTCKGNVRTKGGSVEIEGSMNGGDIVAGGYVKVTGKFHGGKIQAATRIHINGEFSGTLESSEIEVGSNAQGKGELVYREHLSIEKGARVEGRVVRLEEKRAPEKHGQDQNENQKQKVKKGLFSKKN